MLSVDLWTGLDWLTMMADVVGVNWLMEDGDWRK
jgi:hypothetical protein